MGCHVWWRHHWALLLWGLALGVNSERYWEVLRNFLVPQLQEFECFNIDTWFQQDRFTCHTSNQWFAWLPSSFSRRKRSHVQAPLTGLQEAQTFYPLMNTHQPRTLLQLKQKIRSKMAAISRETCRRVVVNFRLRLEEYEEVDIWIK